VTGTDICLKIDICYVRVAAVKVQQSHHARALKLSAKMSPGKILTAVIIVMDILQ
jgi:hypothetical protein